MISNLDLGTLFSTGKSILLITLFDNCCSVLVGKASVGGDWNVVLACAVSILGPGMKIYL